MPFEAIKAKPEMIISLVSARKLNNRIPSHPNLKRKNTSNLKLLYTLDTRKDLT